MATELRGNKSNVIPESRDVPDIGNGEFGFTQHKTEFIILPGLDWQHDIMIHTLLPHG